MGWVEDLQMARSEGRPWAGVVVGIASTIMVIALIYNMWISFRVVADWTGVWVAVLAIILFPITVFVLPLLMLFINSDAAGAWSLWPALFVILALQRVSVFR